MEKDPLDAYLDFVRGIERRAKEQYEEVQSARALQEWCRATTSRERAEEEVLGEDCPRCGGEGVECVGWTHGWAIPPEPILEPCTVCRGKGWVFPEVSRRWREEADDA